MKRILVAWLLLASFCLSVFPAHALPKPIFASYEENSSAVHTIAFDSDGGSYIESMRVAHGESAMAPITPPRKDGYRFTGWYTKDGEGFDFFNPVTENVQLKAGWAEDTVPAATGVRETLQLDPAYLELWQGMTLQLNSVATANVVRSDGFKYIRYFTWSVPMTFYSLDSSIASVDGLGNVTAHSLGTTYVWAVVNETVTASFEGVEAPFTVEKGTVLPPTEVCVTAKPLYYRDYESDPQNQQISLPAATHTNVDDFISYPADGFGSANVAVWYGNRNAAFTMTVDDNIYGDFPQWNAWNETFGIPATFVAPTALWFEMGDAWQKELSFGMSVQSHSHYHHSSAEYSDHRTSAQDWGDFYYAYLDLKRVGIDPLTVAYPCGYNCDWTRIIYAGGRGATGFNNNLSIDYNKIKALGSLDAAKPYIPALGDTPGGWLCIYYHSIGKLAASTEEQYAILKSQIDAGKLWATTFDAATQYAQERDTATVLLKSADQANGVLRFSLSDRMNDRLFYHPLSVKLTVDDTWSGARAMQNGVERACEILTHEGKTYVMVDAVPDAGEVTVVRTDLEVSQSENSITFTPADGGKHNDMPISLSFTVDKDTWAYCTALQGGKVLSTSLKTVAGVTTLTVTAYPNAGEVTVTPTLGEDLDHHTMAQVHSGQVKASTAIPVWISSAEDLCLFSDYVWHEGETAGVTFLLTSDIDMQNIPNFTPIGWEMQAERSSGETYYAPFSGIFDGQDHAIHNLLVNRDICGAGLFGYISGGAVRNLTVYGNMKGTKRVGGIVGDAVDAELTNLLFCGNITAISHEADRNGAGFVGGIAGRLDSVPVTNCLVLSTHIRALGATPISRKRNSYDQAETVKKYYNNASGIGGIVGGFGMRYKPVASTQTTLDGCIFTGSVSAKAAYDPFTGEAFGAERIGGLVGSYGTTLRAQNCLVDATVEGRAYVGGIIGYQFNNPAASVVNCAAYGHVKGEAYVGGISGYLGTNNGAYLNNNLAANTIVARENGGAAVGILAPNGTKMPAPVGICYLDGTLPAVNYEEGASGGEFILSTLSSALSTLNQGAATSKVSGSEWVEWNGIITPVTYNLHQVTFLDGEGKVIAYRYVEDGKSALSPAVPAFGGKTAVGWSASTENITADLTLTARYEDLASYTVTFLGFDGEVIAVREAFVNAAVVAPTPTAPLGMRFVGWSEDLTALRNTATVQGIYLPDGEALVYAALLYDGAFTSEDKFAALRHMKEIMALWNKEETAELQAPYLDAAEDFTDRSESGRADLFDIIRK